MITTEQATVVREVFNRFHQGDVSVGQWTDLDECMIYLSWLPDHQLVVETQVIMEGHMNANARCLLNHSQKECFIPTVLDAVSFIIDDWNEIKEEKRLAKKARYVLEYYLALTQTGEIITD
jgi:hypothetical protein